MYSLIRMSPRATRLSDNRSRRFSSKLKRATLLGLALFVTGIVHQTFAQSSVFTYQGRLQDGGVAANGSYDFRFTLWDAASGGTQQPQPGPATVNVSNVQVTAGNFSVQLDFGTTAFPGADRYLEMSVQLAGVGPFTTLAPRTKVTGTPYAIRSLSAANADTVTDGSITSAKILDGTIVNGDISPGAGIVDTKLATISTALKVSNSATTATSANTADAIVARDASGNFSTGTINGNLNGNASTATTATTAGNVTGVVAISNGGTGSPTGNGSGLNNLNATNVATGTLDNARLSTDVVLLNGTQALSNKSLNNANTFNVDGSDATKKIGFDTSGATSATTLTLAGVQTANRTITLPDANTTLLGTNTTQTLTNKTIDGLTNTLTNITATTVPDGSITSAKLASNLTLAGTTTGTFSGPLTGNVAGNTSGSAASFTGLLSGDVTGPQSATVVSTVGTVTAANVASGANLANAATNANTFSAIVRRDANGNFSGQTITADGNVNLSPTDGAGTAGVINQNGTRFIHSFGTNNFFVGRMAGNFTMTGGNNTAIGITALNSNTTGGSNTASGFGTLGFNTTGTQNTGNGFSALNNNSTGDNNTAGGAFALANNTTGGGNTANGAYSLQFNLTGSNNTAIGHGALNNTTGSSNIGIGPAAGFNLTTGSSNIAIGNPGIAGESGIIRIGNSQTDTFLTGIIHGNGSALTNLPAPASFTGPLSGDVTGPQSATVVSTVGLVTAANVASGANLANAATNANTFSAIVRRDASGNFAGQTITADGNLNLSTTDASGNVGVINQNGTRLIHSFGTNNFFAGLAAGNFTMAGGANTASGMFALQNNTTGSNNTASGQGALQNNTTGQSNTANGANALNTNTEGGSNTATGVNALNSNTLGQTNTATGSFALAANTTGGNNTATGVNALQSNQAGNANTATGVQALNNNTSGQQNTASGLNALLNNTTGSNNIALGIGAGANLTTGDNNIDIGNDGVAGESNIIRIGTSQTDTYLTGIIRGNGSGLTNLPAPANFTGPLSGDVTGPQSATVVSTVGTVTAANVASGANLANAATDANMASTIVRRDASGNFSVAGVSAVDVASGANLANAATDANTASTIVRRDVSGNFLAGTITLGGTVNLSTTNGTGTVGVIKQNGLSFIHSFGLDNFFAGEGAGNFTMTGSANTATGKNALQSNTTGINNTASGLNALQVNTIGSYNTAIGVGTLQNNTANGGGNTAIGVNALHNNTTGGENIAVGDLAGYNITTGFFNIDIGNDGIAGDSGIIRIGTTGFQTDTFLTGIIHGNGSALTNLPAPANFTGSLSGDVTGPQGATVVSTVGTVTAANVASGANLANAATDANTASTIVRRDASGNFSAQTITAGGTVNLSTTNGTGTVGVINQNGSRLIHSFGTSNFFAGENAGNFTMTGFSNTAIGRNALQSNTIGTFNVAIGVSALSANTGARNIAVGFSAGSALTTGGNNIDIASPGVAGESGVIRIGNINLPMTKSFITGIRGVTTDVNDAVPVLIDSLGQLGTINSSRRYKQDIKDMGTTSSRLMALRPVTFRYLRPYANGEKPMQFGLIAEEVAETFPELVVRNKEGQPETVKYQDLTPLLLNEVQKQAKTIAELQAQATKVANGNTTTGKHGEAIVTLPDNFVAVNQDFRYQLTVVGQFAQAIVLQEVKGNQFKIKTDKPNVKVSWQVTGIRHDQSAGNQK
jgi:hypothetical protein